MCLPWMTDGNYSLPNSLHNRNVIDFFNIYNDFDSRIKNVN